MPTYECPVCGKTLVVADRKLAPCRPFCSHRCKMIDLGYWFTEQYTVEGASPTDPPQPGSTTVRQDSDPDPPE